MNPLNQPCPRPHPHTGALDLGPMPVSARMRTVDERIVRAPIERIFELARDVAAWPVHLPHYRGVTFDVRNPDGGGVVRMAADRPFGPIGWPTWWHSLMTVDPGAPNIRFRHIGGITTGMEVEWSFRSVPEGTHVAIVHLWDGPRWPLVGPVAAQSVIGPVFVHGIASRTLAGLAGVAERGTAAHANTDEG